MAASADPAAAAAARPLVPKALRAAFPPVDMETQGSRALMVWQALDDELKKPATGTKRKREDDIAADVSAVLDWLLKREACLEALSKKRQEQLLQALGASDDDLKKVFDREQLKQLMCKITRAL
jgi:hypothetical protein